jgi:feruloyl esterase
MKSIPRSPAWLALVAACILPPAVRADERACAALAHSRAFPATVIEAAQYRVADGVAKLPAYCEVTGVVRAVPKSAVQVVLRLPEGWNGKLIGFGGGGWAGNVTLEVAAPGLQKGYATAQTNGGHEAQAVFDTSWARDNPVAMTDFSHRAVHLMTATAKRVVARYYGRAVRRSYFQGCSTGGRMGMMETQRYPWDYDGVIAGAPVYNLTVQMMGVLRNRPFRAPGAAIGAVPMQRVHAAALAACDALDGLADGIVTDPRRCDWDPATLACPAGQAGDDCLGPAQLAALRSAYATVRDADGIVGNWGLTRGGEAGWMPFVQAQPDGPPNAATGDLGELKVYMFGRADYDVAAFDPAQDQTALHATRFAREYEAAQAELAPYLRRGGKLLLWHGFDDPGPSPYATIDYFERARRVNGAGAAIRLFVAPGVYHCRGGPGPDEFDLVDAMDAWVESGKAPQSIAARNSQSGAERPLCAWPALPYYKGSGDPGKLASFACRAPASAMR